MDENGYLMRIYANFDGDLDCFIFTIDPIKIVDLFI